jgi:hypothetical protein
MIGHLVISAPILRKLKLFFKRFTNHIGRAMPAPQSTNSRSRSKKTTNPDYSRLYQLLIHDENTTINNKSSRCNP